MAPGCNDAAGNARSLAPLSAFSIPHSSFATKGYFGMPKYRNTSPFPADSHSRTRYSLRRRHMLAAAAVPIAVMLAAPALAEAATPGPVVDQPGVTNPAQPGTVTPPPPPPPPPGPPEPAQYPQQPPEVRNGPAPRPAPSPDPVEPVVLEELHLPVPVEPVAPIEPPPDEIRVGQFAVPSPPWLPVEVRDAINGTAATAEAQVATALDSIGIPPGRSDRVAGATAAGAGIGGAIGGTVAAAPAAAAGAVVGGLVGGTVGGIAGAVAGTVVAVPVIGTVTSGVAGTAIGAAAGAAAGALIAGAPAAVGGALAGGTVGAGFGAGVGVDQR